MYRQHPEPTITQLKRNALTALAVLAVIMLGSFVIVSVWPPS
jgi:hypothetical protein